MSIERSNEVWIADLHAEGVRRDTAIEDLLVWLRRRLFYYLRERSDLRDLGEEELQQLAADFTQDSVLIILQKLDQFEGRSKFTTWAAKIAVHQALGELRRARWRDVSLDALTAEGQPDFSFLASDSATPEERTLRQAVVDTVLDVLQHELSDRQRQALYSRLVLGIPIELLAEQLETNPNALYKLLHDARKRLKNRLRERGISPEEVLATFA